MAKRETAFDRLLSKALSYPGAFEDHPWGDTVVKVKPPGAGKVFVFLGRPEEGGVSLGVKLGASSGAALLLPFAEPTGYGLGKAGWISARFAKGEPVPEPLLAEWIDASYRHVAPVKLVKALDAAEVPEMKPVPKKPAAAKPVAKKAPATKRKA